MLQSKDEASFKTVVLENQDRVYNTILSFVNNHEEAEDLSQEVFIKAYNALPKFKRNCKVSSWLYRFSVNISLEYLRKEQRQKRKSFLVRIFQGQEKNPVLDIPDLLHPGISLENKERAKILHAAVALLPENQRIAFQLRNFSELSYDEIAEVMEISKSAIESLLFRAKGGLQKKLRLYYEQNM